MIKLLKRMFVKKKKPLKPFRYKNIYIYSYKKSIIDLNSDLEFVIKNSYEDNVIELLLSRVNAVKMHDFFSYNELLLVDPDFYFTILKDNVKKMNKNIKNDTSSRTTRLQLYLSVIDKIITDIEINCKD